MPLIMGDSARMESLQEYYKSAMLATFGGANIYYATLEDDYWSQTDGAAGKVRAARLRQRAVVADLVGI